MRWWMENDHCQRSRQPNCSVEFVAHSTEICDSVQHAGRGSNGIKFTKFDLSDIKVQEALAVVGCNLSD